VFNSLKSNVAVGNVVLWKNGANRFIILSLTTKIWVFAKDWVPISVSFAANKKLVLLAVESTRVKLALATSKL
jgi:hypothetical protein